MGKMRREWKQSERQGGESAEGGRDGGHCKQGTTNEEGLDTSHTY